MPTVGAEGAVPVGGSGDGIGADFENHVESLEAGSGGFAFARNLLDHEAGLDAEVLGHLRSERFNHGADVQRAGEERHVQAAGTGALAAAEDAHARGGRG